MAPDHLSSVLPRVVIVSRRSLRKNKFVDFVGEYHLDLIVRYGAVPVIVPRVSGIERVLESFEPIHGIVLCEGEDIDPLWYHQSEDADSSLSPEEVEEIRRLHASDTAVDKEKDSIELRLAKLCVDRNIPYLGICRGSQVLNVACGGTLYQDIGKQVSRKVAEEERVVHIDYDNYDGHRHPIRVVERTPLATWFNDSLKSSEDKLIMVNSYHHQGVKKLAPRFVPMAFSPDSLIEGYYDPNMYDPDEGRFVMGLQFHPERMRQSGSNNFDYPGCPYAYKEFVRAVLAYQKKADITNAIPKTLKLNVEIENKRRVIVRSFSLAKDLYLSSTKTSSNISIKKEAHTELKAGAEFLESSTLSSQQEVRLKEMGATVRNAYSYFERMKVNEEREKVARKIMSRMSVDQLTDLMSFYHMMGKICGEVVEKKIHEAVNDQVFGEIS